MTFILPSFGASAISAVPGGGAFTNTYSLEYDATDDGARVNTPITLSTSSAWTMSVWFKMPSTLGGADRSLFNSTGSDYFRLGSFGAYNYVEVHDGSLRYYVYSSNATFTNWTHLMYAHNGSNSYNFYLNGVLETTLTYTPSNGFDIDWLYGRSGTFPTAGALLDEVAIFDNDQSSNISAIYNGGVAGDLSPYSANLTHWYRMEEGSGSTVANSGSTSSSDLNLQNTPTFSTSVPA